MTLDRTIPTDLTEAVLSLIVPFILPVARDVQLARETAWFMLKDYNVGSTEEFRLAGQVIGFSMQALRALANAASQRLPCVEACRYRTAAISAKRSEMQAQAKLDSLQVMRRAGKIGYPPCSMPQDVPPVPPDAIVQIGLPPGFDFNARRASRRKAVPTSNAGVVDDAAPAESVADSQGATLAV